MGVIPSGIFSTGLKTNVFTNHRDRITAAILDRLIDLMATEGGVVIDSLADTDLQVIDAGGGAINIRAGIGYDKWGQRIYLSADNAASAILVGTVDLSSGVDLGTDPNVKIDIDDAGAVEIDCAGATPAATTLDEIIANINAAGFGTVAFRCDSGGNPVTTGDYIMLKSSTTGGSSEVEFVAPASNDATLEIFGLSEAGYPHTYNGGGGYAITDDSTTYNVLIEYVSYLHTTGTFEGGYPTGGETEYIYRDDSYKISITTDDPVNDGTQHELLLATVSNTGGTLTITDLRNAIKLRLRGTKQVDTTAPPAPVIVSLAVEAGVEGADNGYIVLTWTAVSDPSGIREYIIQLTLTESQGAAIANGAQVPEDFTLQSFDVDAATLSNKISKPYGNKYLVKIAAKDNSLSQNISPFTSFGEILVGGTDTDATVTLPQITLNPENGFVSVDWAPLANIYQYEYTYTLNETEPKWTNRVYYTHNSEAQIIAPPGTLVKVRVRARLLNLNVTKDVFGSTVSGGVLIGENEKVATKDRVSVLATDDGKSARLLGRIYLPNPSKVTKLAVDVDALTLNSAERGVIRVYRDNAESDAAIITFEVTGQTELEFTKLQLTAGWVNIDAYDDQESGSSQAAITADVNIVYVEGAVQTGTTKGTTDASIGI